MILSTFAQNIKEATQEMQNYNGTPVDKKKCKGHSF